MEQMITPQELQLKKLQEVAPTADRFDPNWFLIAQGTTEEVQPLSDLANEISTRFGDDAGVLRLIAHYSQGGMKVSHIPPHLRLAFWCALHYLGQNNALYTSYSMGLDTTK